MDRFQHKKTEEKINLSGPIFAQKGNSPRNCSKQDTKEPYMWNWGSSKSGDISFFWKWFKVSIGWGRFETHFLKLDKRVHFLHRFLKMCPLSSSAALSRRRTDGRGWLPSLSMMPGRYFAQSPFLFVFVFGFIFLTSGFLCQVLWRFSDIRKLRTDSSTLCWCSYIPYNKAYLSIKKLL